VEPTPIILKFNCESEQISQVPHVTGQCALTPSTLQVLSFFLISSHLFFFIPFTLKSSTLSAQNTDGNALGTDDGSVLEGVEDALILDGNALGTDDGSVLEDVEDGLILGVDDRQEPHVALQV